MPQCDGDIDDDNMVVRTHKSYTLIPISTHILKPVSSNKSFRKPIIHHKVLITTRIKEKKKSRTASFDA